MWNLFLLLCAASVCQSKDSWVITNAVTTVRMAHQNVKVVSSLSLNRTEPTDKLSFSVYDDEVVHISASIGNRALTMQKLLDKEATWDIFLPKKTSVADVAVTYFYTSLVKLIEPTIEEDEDQTWVFRGNVNVFSPYVAQKQETIIQIGGNKSKLGPFYHVDPFTSQFKTIQFRDSSPVAHVPNAIREISISNWGRIHIEDYVMLENRAAISKRAFSRLKIPTNTLIEWTAYIPPKSENIYYSDNLGSIHSYSTKMLEDSTEVKMQARYPILGGWRTKYRLTYDLPTYDHLETNGTRFCLDIHYLDNLFKHMVVDDLILKIVLPEESKFDGGPIPESFTQMPSEWKHATLDTFGRLVLVFNKKAAIDETVKNFHICYTNELNVFARYSMNGVRAAFYIFTVLFVIVSFNRISDTV